MNIVYDKIAIKYPFLSGIDVQLESSDNITNIIIKMLRVYCDTKEKLLQMVEALCYGVILWDEDMDEADLDAVIGEVRPFVQKHSLSYLNAISRLNSDVLPCKKFSHDNDFDEALIGLCKDCGQFEEVHLVCKKYMETVKQDNLLQQNQCKYCGLDSYKHAICDNFILENVDMCNTIYTTYDNKCVTCGQSRLSHLTELKKKGITACENFVSDDVGGCINCIFSIVNHLSFNKGSSCEEHIQHLAYTSKLYVQINKHKEDLDELEEVLSSYPENETEENPVKAATIHEYDQKKLLLNTLAQEYTSKYTKKDHEIIQIYKGLQKNSVYDKLTIQI